MGLKVPPGGLGLRIFTSWKNSSILARFEPANLGSRGDHITPRPPRPTIINVYISNLCAGAAGLRKILNGNSTYLLCKKSNNVFDSQHIVHCSNFLGLFLFLCLINTSEEDYFQLYQGREWNGRKPRDNILTLVITEQWRTASRKMDTIIIRLLSNTKYP